MTNKTIKMITIKEPAPNTKSIIEYEGLETIAIKGNSDTNYTCGKCDAVVAESVSAGQIQNLVFKCNLANLTI